MCELNSGCDVWRTSRGHTRANPSNFSPLLLPWLKACGNVGFVCPADSRRGRRSGIFLQLNLVLLERQISPLSFKIRSNCIKFFSCEVLNGTKYHLFSVWTHYWRVSYLSCVACVCAQRRGNARKMNFTVRMDTVSAVFGTVMEIMTAVITVMNSAVSFILLYNHLQPPALILNIWHIVYMPEVHITHVWSSRHLHMLYILCVLK